MIFHHLVRDIAPPAPPCFSDHTAWQDYLQSEVQTQHKGAARVLLVELGRPVRVNPRFSFCADCKDEHRAAMQAAGRCDPQWLLKLLASSEVR